MNAAIVAIRDAMHLKKIHFEIAKLGVEKQRHLLYPELGYAYVNLSKEIDQMESAIKRLEAKK